MNYRLMGAGTAGLHNGDYLYETKEGFHSKCSVELS
jgi:hypothetical protein